jgi:5'-nucleotidase
MFKEGNQKLLLVTNDDGIEAKGLMELVDTVKKFGKVVVVAPAEPQSAMSHAITVKVPLRIKKVMEEENVAMYKCNGTPVDCVKMAFNHILQSRPDLLLSGINHGSNSATSVFYSGTMGAALEGCINEVPSIGFSLLNLDHDADFNASKLYINRIVGMVLENGLPPDVCLNVNIPDVPESQIRGIKICRQNKGYWKQEYEKRTDPHGRNYFWLTGTFHNTEPGATDTDEWALGQNFVSIVPQHIDMTCYKTLTSLESWNFDNLSINQ